MIRYLNKDEVEIIRTIFADAIVARDVTLQSVSDPLDRAQLLHELDILQVLGQRFGVTSALIEAERKLFKDGRAGKL